MKMKNKLLYFLTLLVLIAVLAGGLELRQQRQQELAHVAPPTAAPWAVHIATVTRGRATRGFPALVLVKGANEVNISPRLGGGILEMGPREGQAVSEGELLARIDTRELEDKVASLQAQRQGAIADADRKARDAQRVEKLLKEKSVSESKVDQQRAEARTAREQARSLAKQIAAEETRLGYARIRAPFAGVISARQADPGDLAAVGKPIYRLVTTGSGRLEVRLPAEVLSQVRPGTEVVLSRGGNTLRLQADRVFPSLDERSLGRLEIDVSELPFGEVPGALLRARVITRSLDDALLVPPDALLPGDGPRHGRVLRLSAEQPPRVQIVPVTVHLHAAEGVAVEGDLQPGERLVSAHETTLLRLRDGDPVRIEDAGR
jgi:RND family efflux transporter MFP subunit